MKDDSKSKRERDLKEDEEGAVDPAATDELHKSDADVDEDDEDRGTHDAAGKRAADVDEDDEDDEDEDEQPKAVSARPAAGASKRPRKSPSKAAAASRKGKPQSKSAASSSAGLLIAGALIVGAASGWFAREARGKTVSPEVQAATAAGEGPCEAWQKQVCEGAGAQSSACNDAKSAGNLLPEAACKAALSEVPATLAKVKAARADCDKLVGKLCKDLGPETGTCKMVSERTQSFPAERCKEMLTNYDKVIDQLQAMEKRGGMHGGPPSGPGGPPGRPGAPPGADPHAGHGHGGPPPGAIKLQDAKSGAKAPAQNAAPKSAPPKPAPATPKPAAPSTPTP